MVGREDGVGFPGGFLFVDCVLVVPLDERLVGLRWNRNGDCEIAGRYLARSITALRMDVDRVGHALVRFSLFFGYRKILALHVSLRRRMK